MCRLRQARTTELYVSILLGRFPAQGHHPQEAPPHPFLVLCVILLVSLPCMDVNVSTHPFAWKPHSHEMTRRDAFLTLGSFGKPWVLAQPLPARCCRATSSTVTLAQSHAAWRCLSSLLLPLNCSSGDGPIESQQAHSSPAPLQEWIRLESQHKTHIPLRNITRVNPSLPVSVKMQVYRVLSAGQKILVPAQGQARSREDSSSAGEFCFSSADTCISLPLFRLFSCSPPSKNLHKGREQAWQIENCEENNK